MATTSDSNW